MKPEQDKTLEFYNHNADRFIDNTASVDMRVTQDRFLSRMKSGGTILDFGCGSGRDAEYFIKSGYRVDAVDGSAEIVRKTAERTGLPVKRMLFRDLSAMDQYDGIWACASILHLPREELKSVIRKMSEAIHREGVIYASFKYGTFEGWRNGRFFTDFTEESFRTFLQDIYELEITECWITADVRPDRNDEKWLNLLLRKRQ